MILGGQIILRKMSVVGIHRGWWPPLGFLQHSGGPCWETKPYHNITYHTMVMVVVAPVGRPRRQIEAQLEPVGVEHGPLVVSCGMVVWYGMVYTSYSGGRARASYTLELMNST